MSGPLRLFIALEAPEATCDELARWARQALGRGSAARRVAPESLHVTLCFLGAQPPDALAEIAGVLAGASELAAAVEELRVGAPAWLPPRHPRVLAVEVGEGSGALAALHSSLCHELSRAIGWQPPRQRFRPHITVARMRPGSERARELAPTPPLRFAPVGMTLFRSDLDPGGAIYTPLASTPC